MKTDHKSISNTIIGIPAMPSIYVNKLKTFQVNDGRPFLQWLVEKDSWVEAKQIIAKYNVKEFTSSEYGGKASAVIKAPFEGIITTINNIESTNWDWEVNEDGDNFDYKRSYKTDSKLEQTQLLFKIRVSKKELRGPYDTWFNYQLNQATHKTYWAIKDYVYMLEKPSIGSVIFKGIKNSPFKHPYDPYSLSKKLLYHVIPIVEEVNLY